MIISEYFQAFKQTSFVDDSQKKRVLGTFSDALKGYTKNPASSPDAAVNKLDSFFFALPPPDQESPIRTEDMFAITHINQEVLEFEISRLFKKNGISEAQPVTFKINKFVKLAAENHPQSKEIMRLLEANPRIADRLRSGLSDASTAAHELHQDYIDNQAAAYSGNTKSALLREKKRSIPPRAEFTMQNGQMATTYYGTSLTDWMKVQQKLISTLIAEQEAKKLGWLTKH